MDASISTGTLSPTAFTARYVLLCIAVSFAFSIAGPTLSWLTGNLRNTSATTLMVPLNVSIAAFGQIIGQSSLTFPATWILALTLTPPHAFDTIQRGLSCTIPSLHIHHTHADSTLNH